MSHIFNLRNVCKRYPHFKLDNINLCLEEGEILGLIGPNGAGKSTIIRILMGLLIPDAGEVEVLGNSIPKAVAKAKWDIGFASEDMRLYKGMTLQWHMDYIRSIYSSWDQQYAQSLLKKFDLVAEQKIKGMSHGQRVKANLLLNFSRKPKLLVLDEPTTGLDPVARQEVLQVLMEVMLDENRSVLFSSHNTQDVEQLSDKITFIDRGQIVNSKDKETFLEGWRRIRIESNDFSNLSQVCDVLDVKHAGKVATLTTNNFSQTFLSELEQIGASVTHVEALSLEEIFVSEVFASRNESLPQSAVGETL